MKFDEFEFSEELKRAIDKLGFKEPTKIQQESIPLVLNGKDVIGESATGSGKTLAFGAGVMKKVIPGQGLQGLILAPTRELAEQVRSMIQDLAPKEMSIISIYGGVAIEPQMKQLHTADVVIATPGRLKDHMQRKTVDLSKISLLVLDEADRMLDMGFIDDIEYIIRACPKKRQTLFFSATFSSKIEHLARKYLHDPEKVMATKMVDPSKLEQVFYDVPRNLKISLLTHLMKQEDSKLIMVFCNTRRSTDIVVKNLKANKVNAIAIHGGFTQNKRTKALEDFSDGRSMVLVCTDVAARGLDVDHVSHVYNYDIPSDPTDYIHRIGRTARAGNEGKVINLLCDLDHENFQRLLSRHREFKIKRLDRPYLKQIPIKIDQQQGRRKKKGYRRY